MKSQNPILTRVPEQVASSGSSMTINGTVNVTAILGSLVFVTAMFSYQNIVQNAFDPSLSWWHIAASIFGLVLALVIIFKPTTVRLLSPVYAVCQGVFLGAISGLFELQFEGIVFQALLGTCGVLVTMLLAYKTGLIKVTNKLRSIIVTATGAIFLLYMINMILGFFGVQMPLLHSTGPMGIGISLLICGVAAFCLLLDFDMIENMSAAGYPKYYEWYGAFSLLITLIWLYLEILRLLSKLRGD